MPSNHPRATQRGLSPPPAASTLILDQIVAAFQKPPDVANVLHGQRRIHQGGKGRRTALFPSNKSGGAIPVESKLELAHAVALERSSRVVRYRAQAICIALSGSHVAYPDFLVEVTGGNFEIHEVKPSIPHLKAEDVQRFDQVERLLRPLGIGFQLIDAKELASGRVLEELLLSYTRGHAKRYTPAQVSLALKVLTNTDKSLACFSDAYRRLAEHDLPPFLADYLDFHNQLASPLRACISRSRRA